MHVWLKQGKFWCKDAHSTVLHMLDNVSLGWQSEHQCCTPVLLMSFAQRCCTSTLQQGAPMQKQSTLQFAIVNQAILTSKTSSAYTCCIIMHDYSLHLHSILKLQQQLGRVCTARGLAVEHC